MNPLKGEIGFEAGGQPYRLVYSINALCALEGHYAKDMAEIGKLVGPGMLYSDLRTIFWAGLQEYHEDLTEKDVGRLITNIGTSDAIGKIFEAFNAAFPEAGTSTKGNPRTKSGDGSTS